MVTKQSEAQVLKQSRIEALFEADEALKENPVIAKRSVRDAWMLHMSC
jgi:hypothetical protein